MTKGRLPTYVWAGAYTDSSMETTIIFLNFLFFSMIFFVFWFGLFVFIVLSYQLALRVPPAVTRLTVYRWLHIMRPGKEEPRWEANIFMASACFTRDVLAILLSDLYKNLVEHTRHTREGRPRRSCHSTSRIWSMTGG